MHLIFSLFKNFWLQMCPIRYSVVHIRYGLIFVNEVDKLFWIYMYICWKGLTTNHFSIAHFSRYLDGSRYRKMDDASANNTYSSEIWNKFIYSGWVPFNGRSLCQRRYIFTGGVEKIKEEKLGIFPSYFPRSTSATP